MAQKYWMDKYWKGDRQIDKWKDGWSDGWVDGQTDRWNQTCFLKTAMFISSCSHFLLMWLHNY